jgi:hypothetical protein
MMRNNGQSLLPDVDAGVGSSVHAPCVANGMAHDSKKKLIRL